jgi:hypothetical protein
MELENDTTTTAAETTTTMMEIEQKEEEEELASPIRTEWPSDSLLKPEHFTIDQQKCLACHKSLGYALPMNKTPKPKYLFCPEPNDCAQTSFLECFVCGNYNNERSGHVVHRPGNSAYTGPSQIYSFMCAHCYKDQMEGEPGLKETQEAMKKYREYRHEQEILENSHLANIASSGGGGSSVVGNTSGVGVGGGGGGVTSKFFPRKRPRPTAPEETPPDIDMRHVEKES